MSIQRFQLLECNDYIAHFNEIKTWFEENMPNFFTSIDIDDSSAASSYKNRGAILNFYEGENISKSFITTHANTATENARYTRFLVRNKISGGTYTNIRGTIYPQDYLSDSRISAPEYYNFIYEIIKITENAVAFSLCNNYELDPEYRRPGIIMFIKTHTGDIATLMPLIGYSIGAPIYTFYDNTRKTFEENNLLVLTKGSSQYISSFNYAVSGFTKSVFTPIPVPGTNDYIPYVHILENTSVQLDVSSDCTVKIGLREYYYNGVIMVETQ